VPHLSTGLLERCDYERESDITQAQTQSHPCGIVAGWEIALRTSFAPQPQPHPYLEGNTGLFGSRWRIEVHPYYVAVGSATITDTAASGNRKVPIRETDRNCRRRRSEDH